MRSFSATDRRPIFMTPAAARAVRTDLDRESGGEFVRITMHPAKVLSPRYAIDFDDEIEPEDIVMEFIG
jgi:hypothetical protein